MKKLPLITVITPSYNQGYFIKQTIESVLSQNYPSVEYIVMDGGSTDNTKEILKKYSKKLKWQSKKDNGQSDAINQGMKKARGEIVCYLNSDDTFLPGALRVVGERFRAQPSCQWLTGEYQIIDSSGNEIHSFVRKYKRFFRNIHQPWLLYVLNYINQPSTFWRRSLFQKVGYFDESLRYCMDYDFWLRLLKLEQPVVVSQPLSQFRVHRYSKGGAMFEQQFAEELVVAQRYTTNRMLSALHTIHSTATVRAYAYLK